MKPSHSRTKLPRTSEPVTRSGGAAGGRRRFILHPSAFILRVGPGLALALLTVGLLWPWLRGGTHSGVSTPSRGSRAAEAIPAPPAAPELSWVLAQRESLRLRPEQVERLQRLEARFNRETKPAREALARAADRFDRQMPHSGSQGVTIRDLQERGAEVSEWSRALASARRAAWEEAISGLTSEQRQAAESSWQQHLRGGKR